MKKTPGLFYFQNLFQKERGSMITQPRDHYVTVYPEMFDIASTQSDAIIYSLRNINTEGVERTSKLCSKYYSDSVH